MYHAYQGSAQSNPFVCLTSAYNLFPFVSVSAFNQLLFTFKFLYVTKAYIVTAVCPIRVPTNSGNHGKPGKSLKTVPCMEKSWNLKKP